MRCREEGEEEDVLGRRDVEVNGEEDLEDILHIQMPSSILFPKAKCANL